MARLSSDCFFLFDDVQFRLQANQLGIFLRDGSLPVLLHPNLLFGFFVQFLLILVQGICFYHLLLGLMLLVEISDPTLHFGFEFCISHLTDDRSVIGFIYGKEVTAIGAFQLLHGNFNISV